jgi:hypothetical protein
LHLDTDPAYAIKVGPAHPLYVAQAVGGGLGKDTAIKLIGAAARWRVLVEGVATISDEPVYDYET